MEHTQRFVLWNILEGLYDTTTNCILLMKSRLLSIKMEANEMITKFINRIKDLSDYWVILEKMYIELI